MSTITMRFAVGKTINMGNFNSARVDYEETVTIEANQDRDAAYAELRERVYGEAQAIIAAA